MQTRSRQSLILALALLLGQWLTFAHDWQHPAAAADVNCQICLHAPNLSTGAPPAGGIALALTATTEAPQALAVSGIRPRAVARIRIRGPPANLA